MNHLHLLYWQTRAKEELPRLVEAIAFLYPGRGRKIAAFNDHPDTTLDDVLNVCKLADV